MRFMNSGAVNSETWASERPIIQSNRVDPSYVEEGINGMTFDLNDSQELAQKIIHLLERPELCRRMGRRGAEFVRARLVYPRLIEQYLEAYERNGITV